MMTSFLFLFSVEDYQKEMLKDAEERIVLSLTRFHGFYQNATAANESKVNIFLESQLH